MEEGGGTQDEAHASLMDHVRHPRHRGLLAPADGSAREVNPLCGDWVELTLRFAPDGTVKQAGFDGLGCSVSQGAASMLFERAVGRPRSGLAAMREADAIAMLGLELNNNRKKCAYVALGALRRAASP